MKTLLSLLVLSALCAAQSPGVGSGEDKAIEKHKRKVVQKDSVTEAGNPPDTTTLIGKVRKDVAQTRRRYETGLYDPTYFAFAALPSNYALPDSNINRRDPFHFEFLVSPFISASLWPLLESIDPKFFVIYRGLYNFYYLTESSGPVVSRTQNLEGFFQLTLKQWEIQFGAGHESNGMYLETDQEYADFLKTIPHRPDGVDPLNPQDFASMGWNYDRIAVSRPIPLPGTKGVLHVNAGFRFLVDEALTSLVTFNTEKIEDVAFFGQLSGRPRIQQYTGLHLGASFFKTVPDGSWAIGLAKSFYLSYQGRAGYYAPFHHSGSLMLAADVNVLKWICSSLEHLPYVGGGFYVFDGFKASIPLYLKWDYGYSENMAFYPIAYAGIGKISMGVILLRCLHDGQ